MLTADKLDAYNKNGYLLLPSLVDAATLADLQSALQEFVEQSRLLTASNALLDIESDHTADAPRLRRLLNPVDNHETFRHFALEGPAAQIAMSILGFGITTQNSTSSGPMAALKSSGIRTSSTGPTLISAR